MTGMVMDHLFHDVLQVEFQLLQPVFLNFLFFSEKRLGFQLGNKLVVFVMLVSQRTKLLTGLHQMRFDVCFD